MAKITLGKRPQSFKRPVTVKLLDGSEGRIGCTFKYRTRKEFGELFDRLAESAKVEREARPDVATAEGLAATMARGVDSNATYLGEILEAWDLDEELTPATLAQLCDELPGAAAALMEAYRAGVMEGHLGN